jgi:ribA/ribD-fused uncharacterized protein
MSIYFSDPEEKPYGRLSNDWTDFFLIDDKNWRSVTQYFLSQKFTDATIKEKLFLAQTPQDAMRLANDLSAAARPDWDEIQDQVMKQILLLKFQRLHCRSVLLKTGDEDLIADIEDSYWGIGPDGIGQNKLGQFLMEIRSELQKTANDASARQCFHEDDEADPEMRQICLHLLTEYTNNYGLHYYRVYTGKGIEYVMTCAHCTQLSKTELEKNLRKICTECFGEFALSIRDGSIGSPEFPEKDMGYFLSHSEISLPALASETFLALKPVESEQHLWIGVTNNRGIWQINLSQEKAVVLFELTEAAINFSEKISLEISQDGIFAAVANTNGQYGFVIDLAQGKITMRLDRNQYHIENCNFSMSFFEKDQRTLFVHATDWNRLDVSDPKSGLLLTKRETPKAEKNWYPEHYLDYFHCSVQVSPNASWIVDNGWVWSPVGQVRTWSLTRWLTENIWESEDGPTKKRLCNRSYFWDGPVCWIDNRTLAVWGHGNDDLLLIPAVLIFDVVTGEQISWFAGPAGELYFDQYLFSCDNEMGMAAWDVNTGERVFAAPNFHPTGYHPSAKAFLSIPSNGVFQVSRLLS